MKKNKYVIKIEKKAGKYLEKLSEPYRTSIINSIYSLSDNPRLNGYIKLVGVDAYRIRVGNYRVILKIDKIIVSRLDTTINKNDFEFISPFKNKIISIISKINVKDKST